MKVLRSTLWQSPDPNDVTHVVVRECDVVSLEEAMGVAHDVRDMLVINDVFEMQKSSLEAALGEAGRRAYRRSQDESNMAMLYYFDADRLPLVRKGGMLLMTVPSPLSVEDINVVLAQLATHSNYDGQNIHAISKDHKLVTLVRGVVQPAEDMAP